MPLPQREPGDRAALRLRLAEPEVAIELHVNESRICQIKQRAIAKLRLHLELEGRRRAA
jgi:DNA-directed RNA polymerase specialized sigma subunit